MSEHPRQYRPPRPAPNASRGPVVAAYADKIDYPCEHCGAEENGWCKTPDGRDAIVPCVTRGQSTR
ncbi:hypothetical protein [Mycobacteroides abscessus]|uniref:hypothetical protein n=1 Tax=Mycobacteroides abscessus TaxID=36809 RepID=UPI0005DE89D2|nr:hypothetical protein [Mycobacteroides abscessus]CPR79413.1 Uncharacterised protein [Mycobacteroides abscessus]CPR88535.1 Uncharacterised protein [Mycobacteroides abscessus]CPS43472.1 Uncharacterised protein [Mycobacteroides abscessus]CPV03264.1 Uncharacterised protein [Mycobacteroides abscessus]